MISRSSGVLLAVVGALALGSAARGQCAGDIDGSGTVGGADLTTLLGAWGPCKGCDADLDADGQVSASDLTLLLGSWGPCPLPWATVLEQVPDPAVVTSADLRQAIIATGLPWRVRDNASQIEMLLVPPGTFEMGCSGSNLYGCAGDELPVHAVTLTNAFYIGRYEVTQAQWQSVMGSNPSSYWMPSREVPASEVPLRPVELVSWGGIQYFNEATGLRLPTEAEWEYAYRGGTTTAFHSFSGYPDGTNNDSLFGSIAWFDANAGYQTHPVGRKQGNSLGLHDMSGNVWECVNDRYSSTYYSESPSTDPPGPATGGYRVLRGGSWNFDSYARASLRTLVGESDNSPSIGFRAARNP